MACAVPVLCLPLLAVPSARPLLAEKRGIIMPSLGASRACGGHGLGVALAREKCFLLLATTPGTPCEAVQAVPPSVPQN